MFRSRWFIIVILFVAIFTIASIAFAAVQGLTINSPASISPGKTMLTVSGTVTCPVGQGLEILFVRAFQQKGNRETTGSFYAFEGLIPCTGSPMDWQGTALTLDGLWQSGQVSVRVSATVCTLEEIFPGFFGCSWSYPSESSAIDARIRAN